jgi:signal transduction histidine kinase
VAGSQALLSRMVENVIDNAVSHNEQDGWIRIEAQAEGRLARLIVENGGRFIDQQQAADLAKPFRRAGADRTGSDNGSGLGLSIVAAIAEAHDGKLNLRARNGGGLLVSIELPATVAPAAGAAMPAGRTW